MKITAGMGDLEDFRLLAEAGAEEVFTGFVPPEWDMTLLEALNRREVFFYHVNLCSYGDMKILRRMADAGGVRVSVTFNSPAYAPEHLELAVKEPETLIERLTNYGSLFIGENTAEVFGDYASGTNHTLPTNGFARSSSGVSTDSFMKKITYQEISAEGLARIGPAVEAMAEAEFLTAHRNAVSIRLNSLNND